MDNTPGMRIEKELSRTFSDNKNEDSSLNCSGKDGTPKPDVSVTVHDNSHNYGIANNDIHSYYEARILILLKEHPVTWRRHPKRAKQRLASVSSKG
jgi:hypothetical protein